MAEVLLRASARAPWPLAQNFDCLKQLAAVSNSRHAQILEVVRRQLWQDGGVNFVLAEFRLVFVEAEAPQPPTDVHDGCAGRPAEGRRCKSVTVKAQRATPTPSHARAVVRLQAKR